MTDPFEAGRAGSVYQWAKVERFAVYVDPEKQKLVEELHPRGYYVRWSDYDRLERANADLARRLRELKKTLEPNA